MMKIISVSGTAGVSVTPVSLLQITFGMNGLLEQGIRNG